MNIALYFGSFNPMHTGHMAICLYIIGRGDIDELRLVVSPANPLKESSTEANGWSRLKHVQEVADRLEFENNKINNSRCRITVSDIEFGLPKPLFTIDTLRAFSLQEPDNRFILVIGADNLAIIEKWSRWDQLLSEYEVWVYPRKGIDINALCTKYGTKPIDARMVDISSTDIRDGEAKGMEMSDYKV